MSDRLAEIEAWVAHPSPEPWDRGQVYADLRDLLAVAKAARDYEAKTFRRVRTEIYNSEELSDSHDALRAALANLEGGAT